VAPTSVGDHRTVSTDLHIDPSALRAAAALLPDLRYSALDPADLHALAMLPGGAALVAEYDRLTVAAGLAGRELTELAAVLTSVAVAVESAETVVVRSVSHA
jgi:hypothetical protein